MVLEKHRIYRDGKYFLKEPGLSKNLAARKRFLTNKFHSCSLFSSTSKVLKIPKCKSFRFFTFWQKKQERQNKLESFTSKKCSLKPSRGEPPKIYSLGTMEAEIQAS